MRCAVDSWVPGLAEFTVGPREARTRWLARDTRSSTSRCSGNRVSRDSAEQATGGTMKLPRRKFLHLAAGAAALPAVSRIAGAQTYPTQPVRIIVGFGPGGVSDILARLIAQWLSERLGRPFVVDNRPGAGTNIATETVARAPADGYTLLWLTSSNAINATLYEKLNFDFIRDIAPVSSIVLVPSVMEVNSEFPAKTVPEFIS